ncbi:hypothetical protein KPL71_017589 [Citrus sinensis]|uniref:Uncharacterized protein n=1 Tax=Citrus sinensis TaxID=2711 RepID=A0ACB8JQR4_CITSI|nr:hypothetical protein KPL71_017589 [Citrus sinensis]
MTTNKERIERIKADLESLQDRISRMEFRINDKIQRMEDTISKLAESFSASRGATSQGNASSTARPIREESEGGRPPIPPRLAQLEFPRYFGGEANQRWQWLRRTYQEEGIIVTWETFVEELWARFGPMDCEDFDEALSRVKQTGTLREYQKEFEKLGNRVQGWTQKALVGTFMGGLKSEISEEIRMFRPRTLKKAISLARMKDEQLSRQRKLFQSPTSNRAQPTITQTPPATPIKQLSWEEMQQCRAQGLCFNYNERFTAGHKCSKAQLLIFDSESKTEEATYDESSIEEQRTVSFLDP